MLFEGHHFYIHDARTSFLVALRRELAALAAR
jgi:surfactin synthase thioesterase subunit